jgi:hypothetical protein
MRFDAVADCSTPTQSLDTSVSYLTLTIGVLYSCAHYTRNNALHPRKQGGVKTSKSLTLNVYLTYSFLFVTIHVYVDHDTITLSSI